MEDKNKRNNWTRKSIEEAKKRINKEIYKRDRQASVHLKLDDLGLSNYVRYVDDIIIVSDSKDRLKEVMNLIIDKLSETNQLLNRRKTRIESCYHGIPFLGRVTYPYGYQKPSKKVISRTLLRKIEFDNKFSLLSSINSSIGILKNYNCRKLIFTYVNKIMDKFKFISFDNLLLKFRLV